MRAVFTLFLLLTIARCSPGCHYPNAQHDLSRRDGGPTSRASDVVPPHLLDAMSRPEGKISRNEWEAMLAKMPSVPDHGWVDVGARDRCVDRLWQIASAAGPDLQVFVIEQIDKGGGNAGLYDRVGFYHLTGGSVDEGALAELGFVRATDQAWNAMSAPAKQLLASGAPVGPDDRIWDAVEATTVALYTEAHWQTGAWFYLRWRPFYVPAGADPKTLGDLPLETRAAGELVRAVNRNLRDRRPPFAADWVGFMEEFEAPVGARP